jgi:Ankyrin repeats (3 copies)
MKANARKAAALFAAVRVGDVERLRALLPPCGDPAEDGMPAEPGGVTPLMAAAASGREAAAEVLLQCGADPTRRDARGRTAAFYARAAGHHHLAERLDTVVDQEKTLW